MALVYPQVLERNPKRLRIALQRFTSQQLAWRAAAGLVLLIVGSQLWARSPLLGLVAVGMGLWIGIPWGLGQILSLDRERQVVTLTHLRGPWGFWRQQVFSYPLAQLQGVRLHRVGQEVLDNQAQESFQVQSQVRLQFHSDPSKPELNEEVIACFSSQVGIKGDEPEAFVLSQRLVRWIENYLSEHSGNLRNNSSP
ncbi:hypothetical protein NW820_10960 [Synechococcus sp. R55.7]|uniref:hypothetical protein n=1 Tax=Synechococcus sp. R55.7 TaxID=2964500 RepID=UPI0039C2F0AD